MSDVKAKVKHLIHTLGQDITLAKSLSERLSEQHRHLALVNSEGLERVNPEIERLTAIIKQNATNRTGILKSLGLSPNDQGLRALASKLPPTMKDEVNGLWDELKREIKQCKKLNEKSADQLIKSKERLQFVIGNQSEGYPEQIF